MSLAEILSDGLTGLLVLGTFALALVTLGLLRETKESAKRQLGVNTWLHFIDRWDSQEMKRARLNLAEQFQFSPETRSIEDTVLDFFEQVGTTYRLGCVDKELAYSSLSYDAENWWKVLEEYVNEMRGKMNDPGVYKDFEDMVKSLQAAHPGNPKPSDESVKLYLKDETKL